MLLQAVRRKLAGMYHMFHPLYGDAELVFPKNSRCP